MIQIAKPLIGAEEKQAVLEVLDSGMLAQGGRVKEFEEAFAAMCGVRYAVATSSGTTALHTALLAHGIGAGDEVILSPFTFIASANSILYTGARPVFTDIDPLTFNINPDLIEPAVTPRTKAIMPIHLFGLCCDMDPILRIAEKYGLTVIEDACQSHGACYKDHKAGSFGTGAFSLYPTKNITSAEGGMITTDDAEIADQCRVIRQHGMRKRYYHDELGYNFRMTDIHAAIGLAQLHKLAAFNETRGENARYLNAHLKGVATPVTQDEYSHVFHQYTVRVSGESSKRRDSLKQYLFDHGVGSEIYYPVPVHKQRFYTEELGYDIELPEAEQAAKEVLSLPIHPGLSPTELSTIAEVVNCFTEGNE